MSRRAAALQLVEGLQLHFTRGLEALGGPFARTEWLRDAGRHGGGARTGVAETKFFNRASVNVSQVHYDDEPSRKLGSATALSTIIHPRHPRLPSVHVHLSFTEPRDGRGTWRWMADLNPSLPRVEQTEAFRRALVEVAPGHAARAFEQGEKYFFIPALGRHRGVTHFYVESFASEDFEADLAQARRLGFAALETYLGFLREGVKEPANGLETSAQLAYHTLYFFQVLTLDRGTTSGLLVHDQNDLGIMGSLPAFVDKALLASWAAKVPAPQDQLVRALVSALNGDAIAQVDDQTRLRLAQVVRSHYRAQRRVRGASHSGSLEGGGG